MWGHHVRLLVLSSRSYSTISLSLSITVTKKRPAALDCLRLLGVFVMFVVSLVPHWPGLEVHVGSPLVAPTMSMRLLHASPLSMPDVRSGGVSGLSLHALQKSACCFSRRVRCRFGCLLLVCSRILLGHHGVRSPVSREECANRWCSPPHSIMVVAANP
jgi:hypothetical protein